MSWPCSNCSPSPSPVWLQCSCDIKVFAMAPGWHHLGHPPVSFPSVCKPWWHHLEATFSPGVPSHHFPLRNNLIKVLSEEGEVRKASVLSYCSDGQAGKGDGRERGFTLAHSLRAWSRWSHHSHNQEQHGKCAQPSFLPSLQFRISAEGMEPPRVNKSLVLPRGLSLRWF